MTLAAEKQQTFETKHKDFETRYEVGPDGGLFLQLRFKGMMVGAFKPELKPDELDTYADMIQEVYDRGFEDGQEDEEPKYRPL